ncbi:hypothetical protein BN2476_840028 [Paraburkholderia piptadeniae]|uniref:CinA C-terminal domain-containing protein n=1 Tax=Paraburkholderia piptadeniae TaxID=1701573 RepID=A0A1N7SSV6_9BURK|nr:hypothetical protein BN2476_840028 [Paraburkholderia piptadeniae]
MNVPRQVVSSPGSRGLRLAAAESCTAGLIASLLAEVPGSGTCLDAGFVAYSPEGKAGFPGVREATMQQYGLTSGQAAREMAQAALRHEGGSVDVSVAKTGVADGASSGGLPRRHAMLCMVVPAARRHRDIRRDEPVWATGTRSGDAPRSTRSRGSSMTSTRSAHGRWRFASSV